MTRRWFPSAATILALLAGGAPGLAQEVAETAERPAFERRYIDAGERRRSATLLRDWPELDRLIRWSHGLQDAVESASDSLPEILVDEFRARLDSLEAAPLPPFVAAREDSVRAVVAEIRADLDGAEAALAAPALSVSPAFGAVPNARERQRTLVTGGTAVTVPAGVAVGSRDTLPAADVTPGAGGSFLDRMADALTDLDRLVHITRGAGADEPASADRAPPAPAPSARTEPRPPGR